MYQGANRGMAVEEAGTLAEGRIREVCGSERGGLETGCGELVGGGAEEHVPREAMIPLHRQQDRNRDGRSHTREKESQ
jgi:hypothetical protein